MLAQNITLLEDALTKGMLPDIDTFPSPFTGEKAQTGVIRIIFPELPAFARRRVILILHQSIFIISPTRYALN